MPLASWCQTIPSSTRNLYFSVNLLGFTPGIHCCIFFRHSFPSIMSSSPAQVADPQPSPPSSVPCSPRSNAHISASISPVSPTMKDLSASTSKQIRNHFYPKKRPSPHRDGVSKSRCRQSPAVHNAHRTPAIIKAQLQRQREAQILALRKEGIYIEEEYREEICFYMHEMEVSLTCSPTHQPVLNRRCFRDTP